MWYEGQLDNSPFKSQFVKVKHYWSKYGQCIQIEHT